MVKAFSARVDLRVGLFLSRFVRRGLIGPAGVLLLCEGQSFGRSVGVFVGRRACVRRCFGLFWFEWGEWVKAVRVRVGLCAVLFLAPFLALFVWRGLIGQAAVLLLCEGQSPGRLGGRVYRSPHMREALFGLLWF